MNEVERQVLEAQRSEALRKRAELDVVINYFDSILGAEAKGPSIGATDVGPAGGAAGGDAASPVNEGEFYGMSATKASKAVLERVGKSRPLKTAEIFEAIRKGGVAFKSKEGLYKSLDRDPTFQKIGAGRWGLTVWYGSTKPSGKRMERGDAGEEPQNRSDGTQRSTPEESAANGSPKASSVPQFPLDMSPTQQV